MQRPDPRTASSSTRPAGVANPRRTRLHLAPGVTVTITEPASPAAPPAR